VPIVAEFYGIKIYIYYDDHAEPHFHAFYSEYEAKISIKAGELIAGKLPNRARKLIREWMKEHEKELLANWRRAEEHKALKNIEPLP